MKYLHKITTLIAILFLIHPVAGENYPMLDLKWTYPVESNDVYGFDFDNDGKIEIYSTKIDTFRSHLYVLDLEGNYLYKTWVDKVAQRKLLGSGALESSGEKIIYFMPADLDGDQDLDIIAGSSLIGPAMVEERVYYFELEETPIGAHATRYRWDYIMKDIPSKVIPLGEDVAVSSLDSNVYVFGLYGEVVGKYTFDGAVWDMDIKGETVEGGIFATFKGIYTIENRSPKPLLPTNTRVFKVDKADANIDYMDEIAALTQDGRFIMIDRNNNILWEEEIDGLVEVEIMEFQSKKFARTIIAAGRIIYSIDEKGNLRVEKVLDDHINAMYAYSKGGKTEYVIVGTTNDVYLYQINPDYSIYNDGDYYLRNARTYYLTERNCDKAVEYAEKCRELFLDIGYADGALKCYLIITQCGVTVTDENKSAKAEQFYQDALNLLAQEKYESALSYAEISLDIFFDAYNNEGILKADALVQRIRKTWNKKATGLYDSGQDSLNARDYANAITYAEEARQIYRKLNNTNGEVNSANLISQANTATSADANLGRAEQYFKNESYSEAASYAEIAMNDYLILGYLNKTIKSGELMNKSLRYIEAEEYFKAAQEYVVLEDYLMNKSIEDLDNASILYKKSREIYEELGDTDKIKECDELLKKISREKNRRIREEIQNKYWLDFYTYGITGGILIVIFYIYLVTRKKKIGPKSVLQDNKTKEQ